MRENSLKYNLELAAFAVISGAAFLYLIVKAASMPLILDEATTFVEFVQTGDLWPTESRWTTNNHLLNTGLMWVFYQLFGDDEFVLRLPNLLAFLLYSLATFNLMRRLKSVSLKLLFALGMVSPMFLLDFFAMARGYGLSFAFLLWACVNWLRAQESKRAYFGAEISFFLAILANLSIIYLWPAFWLLSAWRDLRLQKVPVKHIVLWRLFSILLIAPHIVYALLLNANFTFDLGTGISIYQSFYSHVLILFSQKVFSAMGLLAILVFISFVAFIARQIKPKTELLFFMGMLVVSICVYLVLYIIIDAPLPISRVSLHLFVIWFPGLFFTVDAMERPVRFVASWVPLLLVLFMWRDFADKFSVRYHKDSIWRREQLIGSVINDLKGEVFQGKTIGANYFYRSIMQYQRLKDGTFPYVNTYGFPQKNTDFLLVAKDQKKMVPSNFERFTVLDELFVYRNKVQTQKHVIAQDSIVVGVAANGYQSLLKTETDARQLVFRTRIALTTSNHKNSSILLCTAINDENGEKLFWWSEPLNHHFHAFKGDELGYDFSTNNLPDGHKSISVFLWNMSDEIIDTVDADISIYKTENWHENNE